MLFMYGGVGLLLLGLWLFCLFDVITTDEALCRNAPKIIWLLVVLLLPEVGSLLWLIAGRPITATRPGGLPYKGNTGFPEYDRPGRFVATNPDDDDEFLRRCRERAEEQRQAARKQRPAQEED